MRVWREYVGFLWSVAWLQPCCIKSSVREWGQFSQGQCTYTSITAALGLQMTLLQASCADATQHKGCNIRHEGITYEKYFTLFCIWNIGPTWLAGVHSWCPLPLEEDYRPLSLPWPGQESWTWLMLWNSERNPLVMKSRRGTDFKCCNWHVHLLLLAIKTSIAVFCRR